MHEAGLGMAQTVKSLQASLEAK